MRGHNICFLRDIRKIIFELSSIPPLIWSSELCYKDKLLKETTCSFRNMFFPIQADLDLQPTWTIVLNGTSSPQRPWPSAYLNEYFKWHFFSRRTTVPNYFEIHAKMYNLWPGQIPTNTEWMHKHTKHAHTPNWSCNDYGLLTTSRLDKNDRSLHSQHQQ